MNDQKTPQAKAFNCPSCGSSVTVRALGFSVTVVCQSCSSIIDAVNENYKVIEAANRRMTVPLLIPLGQRGKLHGTLWEVIGFMVRSDASGAYSWREYLLYNPMKGFRWLTEFDGHWNYIVQTKEKPFLEFSPRTNTAQKDRAKYLGKTYHLFHCGTAQVKYVVGEFYWRVKKDEKVSVQDFVAPPEILSCEKSQDEVVWSIGEYISAETVKTAFQIQGGMPLSIGVAPNQPSTVASSWPTISKYWITFLVIMFGIQIYSVFASKAQPVFQGEFTHLLNEAEKVKVSPFFELSGGPSNVEINLSASVQNNWLAVEGDLVNETTGESFSFDEGVEYYSGYDEDGTWSEGSQHASMVLSSIPPGVYHLNLQASGAAENYRISVIRDVVTWSNFIWVFILLSIYPMVVFIRNRTFERARWSTSDFSPYWTTHDVIDWVD